MATPLVHNPGENDFVFLERPFREKAELVRRRQLDTAYQRPRASGEPTAAELDACLAGASRAIVEELVAALLAHAGPTQRDGMQSEASTGSEEKLIRRAFELFELDWRAGATDRDVVTGGAELGGGSRGN